MKVGTGHGENHGLTDANKEIDRTIERLSQQSAQPVQPVQPVQSVAYSPVGASQVSHLGQAQPGQLGQPGQSVRSQPVRQVSMHHVQAHPRAGTLGTRSVSGPVNFQRPAYSGSAAHVWGSSGLTTVWG